MTILSDFGTKLKNLRKKLDLTREEFSERLGSNPSTLYSYEKGRRTPSIEFLQILHDVFDVPPNHFFSLRQRQKKDHVSDDVIKYLEKRISDLEVEKNQSFEKKLHSYRKEIISWMTNDDWKKGEGKLINYSEYPFESFVVSWGCEVALRHLGFNSNDLPITSEDVDKRSQICDIDGNITKTGSNHILAETQKHMIVNGASQMRFYRKNKKSKQVYSICANAFRVGAIQLFFTIIKPRERKPNYGI